jgi:Flp pilus assembly protein TadG
MRQQRRHSGGGSRPGSVTVVVALCLVALLGIVALTVDGGTLFEARRSVHGAADAAALAAATEIWNKNPDKAADTALAVASSNGYKNDASGGTAAGTSHVQIRLGGEVPLVASPTITDPAGKLLPSYVEVTITYYQQRHFSRLFGSSTLPIQARAVARGLRASARYGIIVLDKTASGALNVAGNGFTTVKDGSVIVNSDHATEAALGQGNSGGAIIADNFFVNGGITEQGGNQFRGTEYTGIPPSPDPLRHLPVPDPSALPAGSTTPVESKDENGNRVFTYKPGRYTGGLALAGGGTTPPTNVLEPGIYYMDGGGFSVTGQANLTANGIMIYNAPRTSTDQIYIAGQGKIVITPPTSGPYQGVSIFQARDSTVPLDIRGNGGAYITGAIYAASAAVNVQGNGDAAAGAGNQLLGSQFVSRSMRIAGNGGFTIDSPDGVFPNLRDIRLVE